jgi:hypothetical protein
MVGLYDSVWLRSIKLAIVGFETVVDKRINMALALALLGSTFNGVLGVNFHGLFGTPVGAVVSSEVAVGCIVH